MTEQVYFLDNEFDPIDNYVNVQPGDPYLLLPYGPLVKGGKTRNITKEYAQKFKLPHFNPPIKRGSHKEDAPAVGHLVGLEAREDGLWGIPEITETGEGVIERGDYRYHSPEIIWEGGGFEDPKTGELIEGPLIVGDALLHTPHLGEAAALYSTKVIKETNTMTEEMVQVPVGFLDRFFSKKEEQPEPEQKPDEFAAQLEAVQKERDEAQEKLDQLEAQQLKAQQLSAIKSEFETDEYGAAFKELSAEAEMLASFDEKQREWVLEKFKAFSKQIDESGLMGEKGSEGEGVDTGDKAAFNEAVEKYAAENKVDYPTALQAVIAETPDFAKSYGG
jgi:hypothetical protein